MDTIYKTFRAEVKDFNDETGEVNLFIPLSSSEWDRDKEVVEPTSIKKHLPKFMKHPVLVASHDYRELTNQIGEWKKIKVTENGTEGKPKYYIGMGNEQADWAYKLAKMGVAAFSYGFIPIEVEDGDGIKTPRRTYKEIELLEISQVVIPSNRQAIMEMRSKSIDPIVNEILDEVEKSDLITKPEETDDYIRIPVKECKITATIDISKDEGIKALYCGKEKEIATYLFAKDKGWTMAKARAWVKEHAKEYFIAETTTTENEDINIAVVRIPDTIQIYGRGKVSQEEIMDEIDYLTILIKENGMNEAVKKAALEFSQKVIVELKDEIPKDNAEIIFHIGRKVLGYDCFEQWSIDKNGERIKCYDLRISGSDIPVNIKGTLTNQDIQEAIKRMAKT